MKKRNTASWEYIVFAIIVLLVVGIGIIQWKTTQSVQNNSASPNKQVTKIEKAEGNVTVSVEYLRNKSDDANSTFLIILDTHSENLDSFNFQNDIFLGKDGKGSLPVKVSPSGSGHHRKAEVTFAKAQPPFEITLNNLAGVSKRQFAFERW